MSNPASESAHPKLREGSAEIYVPVKEGGSASDHQEVFYNPPQVFNRDFSVLVLNVFSKLRKAEEEALANGRKERREKAIAAGKEKANDNGSNDSDPPAYPGLTVLEGLAASGLRSVRYWKEVEGLHHVTVNDFDATAVRHMRRNFANNGIAVNDLHGKPADGNSSGAPSSSDSTFVCHPSHMQENSNSTNLNSASQTRGICPSHADVNLLLYHPKSKDFYDVIDLDPYGTASPFLDSAIRSAQNGALLCVTSTDMPILGGNHPETCFYRYGGTALKARYVHEMSLRLLMNAIASTAARHQRVVEPLISCSIDFYVRIFLRVYDSPVHTKELGAKTGLVFQCCQCECFHVQAMGELDYSEKKKGGKKGDAQKGDAQNADSKSAAAPATTTTQTVGQQKKPFPRKLQPPNAAAIPNRYRVPKANEHMGSVCSECGGRYSIGGPFYLGPLYNQDFVKACLTVCDQEEARIEKEKEKEEEAKAAGEKEDPDASSSADSSADSSAAAASSSDSSASSSSTTPSKPIHLFGCDMELPSKLTHITSWRKITGMLTAMSEEEKSVPLHYDLPSICSNLKLECIPLRQMKAVLRHLGYKVSHFHREPNAIKTDAPNLVVYDIIRLWSKNSASKNEPTSSKKANRKPNPLAHLLNKEITSAEVKDLDLDKFSARNHYGRVSEKSNNASGTGGAGGSSGGSAAGSAVSAGEKRGASEVSGSPAEGRDRPKKVARFMPNPEKNWGPKARAKPNVPGEKKEG